MCLRKISPRELCLSLAEVVLADEQVQRRVLCRDLGRRLELRDALRDLLIFNQHETFIDQILERLLVVNLCARKDSQTQCVAMNVLFLLECVALAALAPHAFEPLCIDYAILSQQTNQSSHQ